MAKAMLERKVGVTETEEALSSGSEGPISDSSKVRLLRETRSALAFFTVLVLVIPGSILGATAMLPAPQRLFGLIALMFFLLMVLAVTAFFAVRYPVAFLGYDHPIIVRHRLHGPPTPGLCVLTKPPADREIFRSDGVIIWSPRMDGHVGKLALVTSVNSKTMTARLDIDRGENPWAWEWLDFIELSRLN